MTRLGLTHLRIGYIWLAALAAACLFMAASAINATATVSPSIVTTMSSYTPGAHADMEQVVSFPQSDGNDDVQRMVIDLPAGMIGDPNAVAVNDRCAGSGGTPIDYPALSAAGVPTGGANGNGTSPYYGGCPASSKVGTASAFVQLQAVETFLGGLVTCPATATLNDATNGIYLLKNKQTGLLPGTPEVPTRLGIHLSGTVNCTAFGFIPVSAGAEFDITAEITVRPDDSGLRITIIDDIKREQGATATLGIEANAVIRLNSMSMTIKGMAPAPSTRPFMTNPTRCGEWRYGVSVRNYTTAPGSGANANSNANVDLMPTSITHPGLPATGNDYVRTTTNNTASCGNMVPFSPDFAFEQTTTQAGAPVGLKATMTNPVSLTSARQASYPREVEMKLPVGFKINPAVAERLGAHGCTRDEFRRPTAPTSVFQITDTAPSCASNTEVGTVAVSVPELKGDLYGKVYLGEPLTAAQKVGLSEPDADKNDVDAGIYRLYVFAKRAGLGVKFEGYAKVTESTGQVAITIKNIGSYNDKASDPNWPLYTGLPQFNYSKFVMDFNTNSLGVGQDENGAAISNPVQNPNDQQQMLTNPQVCGDYPMDINVMPWSFPAQGIKTVTKPGDPAQGGLRVTANTTYPSSPTGCNFQTFNPTFDVKLTDDYDPTIASGPGSLANAAPITGAGKHPTMTFTINRQDRQDNLKFLKVVMPEGFGGSLKAAVDMSGNPVACTVSDVENRLCGTNAPKSKVGTVTVKTGSGNLPITIYGDIYIMEKVGAEIQKYTTKLAVITPAIVGPFDLGSVVNKLYLRLNASNKFQLVTETDSDGLIESIKGIPVLYRQIALKLDGINKQNTVPTTDDRPFLTLPSKCGQSLAFQGQITSAGNAPNTAVETANPTSGASVTTGCPAQNFVPTVTTTFDQTTPATPSGMSVKVEVPQVETGVTSATVQQSTINRVRMQFPPGVEMNPAIASTLEACPTSSIDADIANPDANTDRCGANYPKSKLGEVFVNTPLLPELAGKDYGVAGTMYLEQQGPTAANRFRFVLYLNMPGGQQIVRGGARVAGSTNGPTAGLGSTAETTSDTSVIDGVPLQAGQLEADFNGLPDVSYRWMRLDFKGGTATDGHTVPMFVTPSTCQANTTKVKVNATDVNATTSPATAPDANSYLTSGPNLTFTTTPCPAPAFTPTAQIQVTTNANTPVATQAAAHPDMTATILRADKQKDLKRTVFHLPPGLSGAPASTAVKCTAANATAGNCPAASAVGAVKVELGSGNDVVLIDNGKIYNTEVTSTGNLANDEPARLTAIATIQLGPFDLGKMSLPIFTSLRGSDMGLDADVTLPQRFEGIETHYRKLSMVLNGYADQGTPSTADDKPFLTNPSKCQSNTIVLDAWADDGTQAVSPTATYNTTGCPMDFPAGTLPTMSVTPTSTDSESPTGLSIQMTNGTASSFNPSLKSVKIEFPQGMTVNPAVGNDGTNAVCSTALINAGGSGCPAASRRGEVHVKTPLLNGTFDGYVYLEQQGPTKETRFRLAMVIQLPGQKLILRGSTLIDGSSDLSGPTGAINTGTGAITALFDNIVDLPVNEMNLELYSGNRALLLNPATCGSTVLKGEIAPNSGTPDDQRVVKTFSSYEVTGCQTTPPQPTFDATLSPGRAGDTQADATRSAGHPNFNLTIGNLGKSPQLSEFDLDLPAGFVADTVATPRCNEANAIAGSCPDASIVGTVDTVMGSPTETLTVPGKLYNFATVGSDEPARLGAILDVVVGPFSLGKLSIPVTTHLRSDYGITTHTVLPYRYEGIDVYIRQLTLTVNGYAQMGTPGDTSDDKPFMINPTECGTHTITSRVVRRSGPPVAPATKDITINGCPRSYTVQPELKVTPTTTETARPVGLKFEVKNSIENPTLRGVSMEMPVGMEINPGFANGLTTCSSAEIDNHGGAACVGTTAQVGTVTLDTPLLPTQQQGYVFIEQPIGNDKDTRYRTAIVIKLPGKDLIARGKVTIDGSSTIPTGGTGATDTGDGRMRTVFYGDTIGSDLPDLAFSNMSVNFDGGARAMFTNPRSCGVTTFSGVIAPHGNSTNANDATVSDSYTTTSDCTAPAFSPTFTGSVTPTTSAANPTLTMTATTPAKQSNIKQLDIDLPTGLVASTGNVPRCSITAAAQGNCDNASDIGDISASMGTSDTLSEDYTISGDLFNVAPQPGEPARLSARINVVVGPYNLGKLTLPITAELRSDWGVTTHATMPSRYEGISVNTRAMTISLAASVGGKPFAVNPSKCQTNTVTARMTSTAAQSHSSSWNFNTTACAAFANPTKPTIAVAPSTTQAGSPVGLRIDVNSTEGNQTIKRTEFTFPQGLEINPAFAKDLIACPTASVNAADCTGSTKIADVTLTTPLMSTRPQGALYIESPGLTKDDRYRVAMILDLPGRKLVVRGAISINGTTTIPSGATGSVDTGDGQVKADFDNIPDLGWTQLRLDFNAGSKAMLVNPTVCTAHTFSADFTPNSVATKSSASTSYTPTGCGASFAPTFSASVSSTQSAGHPNLDLQFANAANQQDLRKLKIKLPVGLVANTTATTPCTQADARDAICTADKMVGTFETVIGSTDANGSIDDRVSLSGGKIYNVTPNSDEPARMQAVMPVVVGPFDLGKLSIPVSTKLNPDMSVDADTQIPLRYEGIAVKVRQMSMHLAGTVGSNYFMVNPSRCATHTIAAVMESTTGLVANGSSNFTTTGCVPVAAAYNPAVTVTNTPNTAGAPTSLGIGVTIAEGSSTTSKVKMTFPAGFEISPGAGDGLVACTTIDTDGGASCASTSARLATVQLTTPLLPGVQQGAIYLEPSIGRQAATRFRIAMVVQLPGQKLVIRGGTLVDGSSDLQLGLGQKNVGDGHVTAEFPGLPDLGFTDLAINFNGTKKLFVNPKTAGTFQVAADLTPHAGSSAVQKLPSFSTSGGTSTQTGFAPTLTGSLTPSTTGANPNLNLNIANADGMNEIEKFDIDLPKGLVARTQGVPQCALGDAQAGNCAVASKVGTVDTTIGSYGETLLVTGDIVNVVPSGDQPARLFANVPVVVGPFDLGDLTLDVPTKLNSDLTVTASTTLPKRYEGIAVRVRGVDMTIQGEPSPGKHFMVAPSKCGPGTIGGRFTSDLGQTATSSFGFNITGCDKPFSTPPTMSVSAAPAVRNTPVNLTFNIASDPDNPTISKMRVEMPDNVEINPAFGDSVAVCPSATVDAGGAGCPTASKIGVVKMRTHLLNPNQDYLGVVYLEPQGGTAATRFRIAIVIHLPGADIVVRGKVTVSGSTDITGGTGSTTYAGPGKIVAEFDDIPDLGFSSLQVAFNTSRPMLINAPAGGTQTLAAQITPHSSSTPTNLTPTYTTTGGSTPATFNPTFTASLSNSDAAGHGNLNLKVDRTNNDSESIRDLDLQLPVGLVASTVATTRCTETAANAGTCAPTSRVGSFTTRIGNGATATEDLTMSGDIYNVEPRADEPARMSALVNVLVGPFDLGKLPIAITTKLRADAGIDTKTTIPGRYEGIAVHVKQMDITLLGTVAGQPFMQNPSKCGTHSIRAQITSLSGASTVTKQSNLLVSGNCPPNFAVDPTVDVSVDPTETSVPTALSVTLGSDPSNPTIGKMALKLPEGMSINANAGNDLVTCSPNVALVDYGCAPGAVQGTVEVFTPLLGETYYGSVFLEDPIGNDKDTRYRMAIVLELPGQAIVVRGLVDIDGSTTIPTGGTGSVDTGTGRVTTYFDAIPDLSFSSFKIDLKTGPKALLTNPDTCGAHTVESTITPTSGGAAQAKTINSTFTTDGDGSGGSCPPQQPFSPTFSASADDSSSGANTDLHLTVDSGNKDQELTDFTVKLPVGLVADTTATDYCSQADAAAAACDSDSEVGSVVTKLGTAADVGETLAVNGTIYNVEPNSDEPARLAAIVPVVVGPYDLGNLTIQVPTELRPDDYGVNALAEIPTRYEGIRVRLRQMAMTMRGEVGPSGSERGFIKNPSRCDAGVDAIEATLVGKGGDSVVRHADYPVTGCTDGFNSTPTITVSGTQNEIEKPTGMTLEVNTAADNPSIARVRTAMPDGMTINPAVGNKVDTCSSSDIAADNCPAASVVGSIDVETPLLAGTHHGKVVLEQSGVGGAERYRMALIIDVPGTKIIVHGVTLIDGTTDLTNGMGSTAETGVTGNLVADFDDLPDLNFSHMKIVFDNGPEALLANSSECGPQQVSGEFWSHSGGGPEDNDSNSWDLSFDGAGAACPGTRDFNPTFTGSVSSTTAAGNPDLNLHVTRQDKTEALRELNLQLPPGLVADTVSTPRCALADSQNGNCAADTVVGDIKTKIGTGTDLLEMTGHVYNVVPVDPDNEPARMAAIFDVEVGPFDLGKLSIPVTAQIHTGAAPSDLAIDTQTTIPQRYEGVPVRLRSMDIKLSGTVDGEPFMINPSKCGVHTVKAEMKSTTGETKNGSFSYSTTGCPASFNPSIETSVPTDQAGAPTGFTFEVNVPGNSSSVQAVTTTLPEGFEINPAVANRGGANALAACSTVDIDNGAGSCPASSQIGSVTMDTPLLSTQRTGNVYLETPGSTPSTRYKLAIVIDLPGPDLIVHGQAHVNGEGSGVNSGTGQVSAQFENLPDLQFRNLTVNFDAGDHSMLVSPKACGSYASSASLTPWSVGVGQTLAQATVTRTHSISIGSGCSSGFNPGFTASISDNDQAASPDLTLGVTAGAMDRRLTKMTIGLPVGLVANTTAATQCEQIDAEAGNCGAASKIGQFTTTVGAGGDPLVMNGGEIFNVKPGSDEPARLSAAINVNVGPYALGKLVIPVSTKIRPGNPSYAGNSNAQRRYGIDAVTDVPTRFEGVAIQMRSIEMTMYGEAPVSGDRFIVNPSKCGTHTVTAELDGEGDSHATRTSDLTINGCASGFRASDPTISASVNPTETAVPTDFSLDVDSDAGNQTIGAIETKMPLGMTINPAIGNAFASTLTTCPEADVDSGDLSGCASAQIGSVSLTTPLLAGVQTGKVYLVEPGPTAAQRYRMAIAVDVPGQTLIVRGRVEVDGSTDLTDGLGSTNPAATGQLTAIFDEIPDLGFTNMNVVFNTGERSLLTNPETCGTQTVNSKITPTGGSVDATPAANFVLSYDGSGAPCLDPEDEPFDDLTFDASFSTTAAAGNPDVTLDITRQDKRQQLEQLDLELPPGLVANTVATPRCSLSLAAVANCAETSRVGDVTTRVGTGDETLQLSGGIYNVETTSNDEPARLAAVLGVQVGPYNLGKLSVPVTAELTGATASDLHILTHTTLPTRYEGIPVRVRAMQIKLKGTVGGNPFMINPSKCDTHTISAHMVSTLGTAQTATDSFTTDNCQSAPYAPSIDAQLKPNGRAGKPVGLDLGFSMSDSSSSTKSIRTILPVGMGINPGIGTYAAGGEEMACDPADVEAGGVACPENSKIGTVTLDTPLLPTQRTGTVFLETPGSGADNRYRLGIYVSLPGTSLVVHGRARVNGSSSPTNGVGSVNQGNGQVIAEFDNLPDLQWSDMKVTFNTSGSGEHALLMNPETCGSYLVRAQMVSHSRPTATVETADTVSVDNCNGPEGSLGLTAAVSSNVVGEHADFSMNLTRPDGNRSILNAMFELPKGLVGSADAAPTCADDDLHAKIGLCDASTQVGEVELDIGSSEDPFTMTGEIYNVDAPSDRPAKLAFASHVIVGPYDLGRVVVPIDVNIDPDQYFLWAQTGNMPQRFEGIAVRISAMRVKLFGMADQGTVSTADDKPFMSNPRSCDAGGLTIKAKVNFATGSPVNLTSQVGPFTGCENLNLNDNAISVENYNDESYNSQPLDRVPEAPTKLRVKVSQGSAATQAGMKDMTLALPGFRLSAAAADGSDVCNDIQLAAKTCPAASRVGTAWLDTSLLPKNVPDPNSVNPDLHSLWGSVYLLTPGDTAGNRYKLAVQLTGKTTVTIRGTAVVAESGPNEGEMVTEFKGLPDIPFDAMEVDLTGVNAGAGIKPLLLNPENTSTTDPRTVAAGAAMSAWSDPDNSVVKNSTTPVSVLAGTAKGFSPDASYTISTTQSGAHPDFSTEFTREDGQKDIRRVQMHLPAGFLGSAAAVPQCPVATANAGNCTSASQVGTVTVKIGQFGQILPMAGQVYLTEGVNGDIAGMSIKVPAKAGKYDLGNYIAQGRITIRESDHGIDVDFNDVPRLFKGVPTHMSEMTVDMDGMINGTKPFLFNSSSCNAQQISADITSWGDGADASTHNWSDGYQATGCPARTFTPQMSFQAIGGGVGSPPAWTIKMGSNNGDSTLARTQLVLPTAITINTAGIGQACPADQAAARTCSAAAKIGTVSINTPLLPAPVTGTVYMAKSVSGSNLPDMLIDIPKPIDMQIRGANRFVGESFNMIQSTFENLPDLIFTDLTINIAGGPTGLIMLRTNGVCGAGNAYFKGHAGQEVNSSVPITGIEGFCADREKACLNPTVKVSTKGVKKKGNKKAATSLSLTTGDNCKAIKSVRVTYPKGAKFNKNLITYNKKKKATKKNLKNLTGVTGAKKLDSTGFKFSSNRLTFKSVFPAGARSFSVATKNSSLVLPYKTFCGGLKGSKLKKCQKKNVTFTFEITNSDGTAFRYNYTVPAGSKFFK